MKEVSGIQEVLNQLDTWVIIDVRSPSEYQAGHIPGARNVPLFNDEERSRVGTEYKQNSPEVAFKMGLEIAGSKMAALVEDIEANHHDDRQILIHCWRGGKRSQAMQWLCSFSGIPSSRLDGGYKSFRTALQSFFNENKFDLRIIGGCTGAGKTEVLKVLAQRGEQVIDLEDLANHKGSAFGAIGEEDQPSTEQFENELYLSFLSLDPSRPVWLENESKSIGKVHLPEGLWNQMRDSKLYTLEVDEQIRLHRALKYYSEPVDIDLLKISFEKIRKRLGGLDFQNAIKALDAHDLMTAASIALKYYDKSYLFQLSNWPADRVIALDRCNDVEQTADRLIQLNNEYFDSAQYKYLIKNNKFGSTGE